MVKIPAEFFLLSNHEIGFYNREEYIIFLKKNVKFAPTIPKQYLETKIIKKEIKVKNNIKSIHYELYTDILFVSPLNMAKSYFSVKKPKIGNNDP